MHQQWHFKYHSQRQREAFTNICRYVHSLLLINFTDTENCTYRLAVHTRHSKQSTKLVIAPYSSASIDHASSFFRNLTKYKIYTYTQRSSFQLQFFNKVKGTSILQPLPINPHRSCLTWPYNHKTKRLKLFYTITDRSQQALRNITKPRICPHNILATVTFHHKAATTIRSSQGLPNITL